MRIPENYVDGVIINACFFGLKNSKISFLSVCLRDVSNQMYVVDLVAKFDILWEKACTYNIRIILALKNA